MCDLMLLLNFSFIVQLNFQNFQLFRFSFFQVKRVNHCEGQAILLDIEHQLQKKYPTLLSSL